MILSVLYFFGYDLIYTLYPSRHERTSLVRDQFGRRYLNVRRSVLLGVPSLKLKWTEV